MLDVKAPAPNAIEQTLKRLAPYVVRTPVTRAVGPRIEAALGTQVVFKLELLQHTGTFKFRGALNNMLALEDPSQGVTTVSAGNHAVAVARAAKDLGRDAKLVMLESANPARRALAAAYGCELKFCADGPTAFAEAERLAEVEGRAFIHPFDGPLIAEATACIGFELIDDCPDLEAVVVAIGGGGLAGGFAAGIKQRSPNCEVYGVEPVGADGMSQSLAAGAALTGIAVTTIADSLAPPLTTAHTVGLCARYIDAVETVDDEAICRAMALMFEEAKLAVEPAGAAALAGALGPLNERLRGRRVGILVCGTCIDAPTFARLLERGSELP